MNTGLPDTEIHVQHKFKPNNFRFPGAKNNDVFFQMIDLDKGVYGEPYNVSLFLHVISGFDLGFKNV